MAVKRIRQVFVAAADFDAQCTFYESVLGLEQQFRDGQNWAQFGAGDITLAVAGGEEAMGAATGSWVPVFEVDALEPHLEAISAAGGRHGAVRDMGDHGRTVLAEDAAGAQFALLQK